jgi:WS/DGAT/MGAT family acyltransferase
MAHYNYKRLSTQDNDFLLWETAALPMHTSSIQLFEAGDLANEPGGIDFERIKRATEFTLHRMPRYRQKLSWVPGGRQAVWVDDSRFNIDYHLRHISLPRPGNDAQLKRLASHIMEVPLDRSRPLWETWVIEGLEGGRFATIMKTHHCMIDGSSGMDLMGQIMTTEPHSEIPESPRFVPSPQPSAGVLRRDERAHRWSAPARLAGQLRRFVGESEDLGKEIQDRVRALGNLAQYKLKPASQTPLNGEIGPHRVFEFADISLADLKAIRKQLDASINDLVLTIVTGALRRFLTRRSVRLRDLDFRVSTPVNVRTERDRGFGNRVSAWIVPLPLGEADPLRQLERIRAHTRELKDSNQAIGIEFVNALNEWIPIDLQSVSAGTQNMIVTNVPGPQFPLYMLGAKLLGIYPQAPLIANVGLVIGLISYNGRVCWGLNADQDRVPDLADFRADILRSFERLAEAAEVAVAPVRSLAAGG